MVSILTNGQSSNTTFNVDTGELFPQVHYNDSLVNLATDIGMVDTMNDINNESYVNDRELREEFNLETEPIYEEEDQFDDQLEEEPFQEEPQQQRPKKKSSPKKTKGDKRYDDLIYKLGSKAQEAEEIARQRDEAARELKFARDEHAAYVLEIERQRINDDIERVTNIMVKAKDTDQTRSYVEGTRIMNELIVKGSQTDAAINQLAYERDEYNSVPDTFDHEKAAEDKFYDLSDVKEVNSLAYAEWLKDNAYYNPYDAENFDEDLAEDVHEIKRTFNKYLKHNRNGNFIGTPDYYQELDSIVQHKLYGDFIPAQQQQYSNRGYSNQQEEPPMKPINYAIDPDYDQSFGNSVPEGQSRIHKTYPDDPGYQGQQRQQRQNVAPVNRSGYNQQHQNQQVASLDERERKLAIMFPMVDTNGRPLSEREKLQKYAADKASMYQSRR